MRRGETLAGRRMRGPAATSCDSTLSAWGEANTPPEGINRGCALSPDRGAGKMVPSRGGPMPKGKKPEQRIVLDEDAIDDAVLALLYLTLHDGFRAWKGSTGAR